MAAVMKMAKVNMINTINILLVPEHRIWKKKMYQMLIYL